MTERQILLVKHSWSYVIVHSEEAGREFYARLFEVAPQVRSMFPNDIRSQAKKLMDMVTLMVVKLQKMDVLLEEVRLLAKRHVKYGAYSEHYAVVGECLIWTLRNGLGEKWNAEMEDAWLTLYSKISEAMMEQHHLAEKEKR